MEVNADISPQLQGCQLREYKKILPKNQYDRYANNSHEYLSQNCKSCLRRSNMYLRLNDLPNEIKFELERINYSNPYEMYDLITKLSKQKSNNVEWLESLEFIKIINIIRSKVHTFQTFKQRLGLGKCCV